VSLVSGGHFAGILATVDCFLHLVFGVWLSGFTVTLSLYLSIDNYSRFVLITAPHPQLSTWRYMCCPEQAFILFILLFFLVYLILWQLKMSLILTRYYFNISSQIFFKFLLQTLEIMKHLTKLAFIL